MTEKSFTFFEIHLHDGLSFSATNTAPAIGGPTDEQTDDGTGDDSGGTDTERDSGSKTPSCDVSGTAALGGLVALAVLVAGAALARRFRGDDDALSELDDIDE